MPCIFCEIINGNAPGYVLYRDELVVVFLSLEGHPLVVPLLHIATLEDIGDETSAALFQCATKIARAVRAATNCEGINLVLSDGRAAGQDVFHLHLHVKPRWIHDNVTLTWDTKAISDGRRGALAGAIAIHLPTSPKEF